MQVPPGTVLKGSRWSGFFFQSFSEETKHMVYIRYRHYSGNRFLCTTVDAGFKSLELDSDFHSDAWVQLLLSRPHTSFMAEFYRVFFPSFLEVPYILKVLSVSLLCVSFPLLATFPPLYITLPADLPCNFFTTTAFCLILLLDFACRVIRVKKYNPQLTWMCRYGKSEKIVL